MSNAKTPRHLDFDIWHSPEGGLSFSRRDHFSTVVKAAVRTNPVRHFGLAAVRTCH